MTGADERTSAHPVTNPRDYVTHITRLGLPPIPIKNNSKVPSIKWAEITIDKPADFTNHHGNVGIKLGEFRDPNALFDTYLFALDIDVKNGDGIGELDTLQATHGPLPETWTATTPSGGRHLLFRSPVEIRNTQANGNRLAANIDIRGEGGYIVTAPSTIDGEPYRWERSPWETEIGDAPGWLIDLLTAEPEQPEPKPTPSPPSLTSDSAADRLRDDWDWPHELQRQGWALHHSDGDDTYWTRPDKPTSEGHSAVLHGNGPLVIWTTDIPEQLRKLGQPTSDGSGITVTPFDWYAAHNHHGNRTDAAAAIHEASRKAEMTETESAWESVKASTPASPRNDEPTRRSLNELLIDWSTINDRPDALIDGLIFPGRWTAIYSEPKQGKSTLLLGLSLAAARGHDPIIKIDRDPVSVLYCDGEMGRFDLAERLEDFGYQPEHLHTELPGWHAIDLPLKLGKDETASQLITLVNELDIRLVVLDGLNGFLEGEENSSGPILELFEATIQPLKKLNVAIVSGDNSGKDKHKGSRGSSVKNDKPDGVLLLTQLADNELRLDRQLARTSAYPDKTIVRVLNLDNSDPTEIAGGGIGYPKGTRELADQIDALENINDLKSHEAIKRALRQTGVKFPNNVFIKAMQFRTSEARRDPFRMGGDEG